MLKHTENNTINKLKICLAPLLYCFNAVIQNKLFIVRRT